MFYNLDLMDEIESIKNDIKNDIDKYNSENFYCVIEEYMLNTEQGTAHIKAIEELCAESNLTPKIIVASYNEALGIEFALFLQELTGIKVTKYPYNFHKENGCIFVDDNATYKQKA